MKKIFVTTLCLFAIAFLITNESVSNITNKNSNSIALASPLLNKENQKSVSEVLKEQYGNNYKLIIEKNNESLNNAQKIEEIFTEKVSDSNKKYLPIYGGTYINEDNDLVVLLINDETLKFKETKIKLLNDINTVETNKSNIIVDYVDYSYEKLEKIYEIVVNYIQNHNFDDIGITISYIDVANNKVIVALQENTLEKQNLFKKVVVDSDIVEFIDGERPTTTDTYNPGGSLFNSCSIGYRAKLNNKNGFVTAGHCVSGNNVPLEGYGTVKKREYFGNLDAAFVELSSGNTVTNTLQWASYPVTQLNTSENFYIPSGTIVYKVGINTQVTSGKIISTNATANNSDGVSITNLTYTTALCQKGDSGGVVFINYASNTGTAVGIVASKDNPGTGSGQMLYTKAELIKSKFGITRY